MHSRPEMKIVFTFESFQPIPSLRSRQTLSKFFGEGKNRAHTKMFAEFCEGAYSMSHLHRSWKSINAFRWFCRWDNSCFRCRNFPVVKWFFWRFPEGEMVAIVFAPSPQLDFLTPKFAIALEASTKELTLVSLKLSPHNKFYLTPLFSKKKI